MAAWDAQLGDGVKGPALQSAGGWGVVEGGNLGRVEAVGQARGLGVSGGCTEGVGGEVGVWGGGGGGFRGVGAAGEQTGDEACKAQGGYFEEIAFGS